MVFRYKHRANLQSFFPANSEMTSFNPIHTGLFLVLWDREEGPPPFNSENIKAMTTKLKEQIVRPKMFPSRSATLSDDVIGRHNNDFFLKRRPCWIRHLGFLKFPKAFKNRKN